MEEREREVRDALRNLLDALSHGRLGELAQRVREAQEVLNRTG